MVKKPTLGKSSARDVFSYLLLISMFYTGVVSFIALLWQYVNVLLPDPLDFYYTGALNIIRNSMSALIIVWPVVIGMSWLINKDIREDKDKKNLWIRKWLLYLTLFISAITIIVDLITLTNSFLGGELTTRFGLKVLIVLTVAVAVFWYYMWELKRDAVLKTQVTKIAAIVSAVLIAGFVVTGFFIVGSPKEQRAIKMDNQRISDLQIIQSQMIYYWQQKERLPQNIEALKDPLYGIDLPKDPVSGTNYEFILTGDLSFKLCATFDTVSRTDNQLGAISAPMIDYRMGEKVVSENWLHDAGYTCFERSIDPELYKVNRN